jgi:hypothetical protein
MGLPKTTPTNACGYKSGTTVPSPPSHESSPVIVIDKSTDSVTTLNPGQVAARYPAHRLAPESMREPAQQLSDFHVEQYAHLPVMPPVPSCSPCIDWSHHFRIARELGVDIESYKQDW